MNGEAAGLRRRSRPAAPVLLARENPVLRRSPDSRLVPGPRELYAPYPYDMQKAGDAIRPRGGNDCEESGVPDEEVRS